MIFSGAHLFKASRVRGRVGGMEGREGGWWLKKF